MSSKDINSNDLLCYDYLLPKKHSSKRSNMSLYPPNSFNYIIPDDNYEIKKRQIFTQLKEQSNDITRKDIPIEISFETQDSCIECNFPIDIEVICYDFENIQKDAMWSTCPSCENYTVPRLGIKVGGFKGKSTYEKVVLYSPYNLKSNFSKDLVKEHQLNLDLKVFRFKLCDLFWNSVWYFSQMGLPYDLMLPYQEEIRNEEFVLLDDKINKISPENLHDIISPKSQKETEDDKFPFENLNESIPFENETEMKEFCDLNVCSKEVELLIKKENFEKIDEKKSNLNKDENGQEIVQVDIEAFEDQQNPFVIVVEKEEDSINNKQNIIDENLSSLTKINISHNKILKSMDFRNSHPEPKKFHEIEEITNEEYYILFIIYYL
jgi:hypothetical protein